MAQMPPVVLDPLPLPGKRDGLLDAATGPLDLPTHAKTAGALWETDLDGVGHLYPVACQAPPYPALADDGPSGLVAAYSFDVYATQKMPAVGHLTAEAERRVRTRLQLHEQQAVEAALWGGGEGVEGIFEILAAAGKLADLTPAGGAASVVEAVSLLEQDASVYPASPMIHARLRMGAYLSSSGVIRFDPSPKPGTTHAGARFVLGAGYAGTGPAGEAVDATTEWIYGTGRVVIWRDPEMWVSPPGQVLDREKNQRGLVARRTYMVAVEGYAAGVKVTRS